MKARTRTRTVNRTEAPYRILTGVVQVDLPPHRIPEQMQPAHWTTQRIKKAYGKAASRKYSTVQRTIAARTPRKAAANQAAFFSQYGVVGTVFIL